ncbi:MAG: cysteine--tRNA ligase [Spirochaetales bacterium]|nr:cysteine--tRNA ligase [Spirochaetales bacterium]
MKLEFYNTSGRKIEEFVPVSEGKAGFYCCGPTVYNYAHIGNLRTYVFEDLLRRVLAYAGYEINHVMNITDVGHLTDDGDDGEDKMEKSARETGRTVWDIARHYTDAFFNDTEKLNIIRPEVTCTATEHIQEMIDLIKKLEEKGFTYLTGGNLYFDISKFPEYGKMALIDRQNLQAGARVAVDENKRNPGDFVLWFTKSKFENHVMLWDSPWGKGYPGWHVECSAMSMKYLGEHMDIHCGGVDHIPIHHTNEIAQSEGASGKKWVNYWLHGEFLLLKKAKMSKSSGSFLTLTSLEDMGFDPLDYRYFCLGGHYRSQLIFSEESLEASKSARKNLNERILKLKERGESGDLEKLDGKALEYLESFRTHIARDLGVSRGLSDMWQLLKDPDVCDEDKLSIVLDMDRIFGLSLKDVKAEEKEGDPEIDALVEERNRSRSEKNFARADEIRDELLARGIEIKDSPQGTVWERK